MLSKNFLKSLGILSISGLFLAGCGDDDSNSSEASGEGSSDDSLVIYTNSLDDDKEEWLQKKSTETGFDVEFVVASDGDIYNRVTAGANDPQADVFIGMDGRKLLKNDLKKR